MELLSRVGPKRITLLFSLSFAIASLIMFSYLFTMFLFGYTIRFQEHNAIIASAELISSILAIMVLVGYFYKIVVEGKDKDIVGRPEDFDDQPESFRDAIVERRRKNPLATD